MNEPTPAEEGGAPGGVRTVRSAAPAATRLVLVRHGEAACNVGGVVGGRRGCTGLTELGRRQATALATQNAQTMIQLQVEHARMRSEMLQVLTPDQKTKFQQLEAKHAQRWQKHASSESSSN